MSNDGSNSKNILLLYTDSDIGEDDLMNIENSSILQNIHDHFSDYQESSNNFSYYKQISQLDNNIEEVNENVSNPGTSGHINSQEIDLEDHTVAHVVSKKRIIKKKKENDNTKRKKRRQNVDFIDHGSSVEVEAGLEQNDCKWGRDRPLEEVWKRDEDLPTDLLELVMKQEAISRKKAHKGNQNDSGCGTGNQSDATDTSYMPLEVVDNHFHWASMDSFEAVEEPFLVERTGAVESYDTEYDAFRSYWGDDILEYIADQTNIYATMGPIVSTWYPTNAHEIMCLFAFWIMQGIIKMPNIKSCFTMHPLLKTDVFRRIFNLSRFDDLTRFLQFFDDTMESTAANDRLCRLRPILTHLNERFQKRYIVSKNLCIKQYIPKKCALHGIKIYELSESGTAYLCSFTVYTGKQDNLEQNKLVKKSVKIIRSLMGPLLNRGYRLFIDNLYNSPLLARWLKMNRTDCVGILRSSRNNVPPSVQVAPLQRGQLVARHSGDVCVVAWQDKERVHMMSTCHGSAAALPFVRSKTLKRSLQFKPQVALDYDRYIGGADLEDQKLDPHLRRRNCSVNWYMKLFRRLLKVSVLNARTLYASSKHSPQENLQFRLNLVESILERHLAHAPITIRRTAGKNPPLRHRGHWPVRVRRTEVDKISNRTGRKRCVVCYIRGLKDRKTPYECEACRVPLCIVGCMKDYHTLSKDKLSPSKPRRAKRRCLTELPSPENLTHATISPGATIEPSTVMVTEVKGEPSLKLDII